MILTKRKGKLLAELSKYSNSKLIIHRGEGKMKMRDLLLKCKYRYRRTRRLPNSSKEKRKNNLRDHYCYITILISRAREFRFRIDSKINPEGVK